MNALLLAIAVTANFPGGNVQVNEIDATNRVVRLMPDARSDGLWFYTNFKASGAAGESWRFEYEPGRERLTKVGPAVSADGGVTWRFLNAAKADSPADHFEYQFGADETNVQFAISIPYLHDDWAQFVKRMRLGDRLEMRGDHRGVETLMLKPTDEAKADWEFILTCRHHACESSASFVVEGMIEAALGDTKEGRWLREHAVVAVVPFVDAKGVEAGDQGKMRKPHDHNRDYILGRYESVRAIRELVTEAGKLRKIYFVDNHAPWIRESEHDHFYTLGAKTGVQEDRWNRWRDELEKLQANGALKYERKWDRPYGDPWNRVDETYRKNRWLMSHDWVMDQPNVHTAFTTEIGYGLCGGVFSPEAARELGRNMMRAMVRGIQ